MDELLQLLADYFQQTITPEEFSHKFHQFRYDILREQDEAIREKPEIHQALEKIADAYSIGRLNPSEYAQRLTQLVKQITDCRIPPMSQADEFLSELFTPIEQYDADPEARLLAGYTDEAQLMREVSAVYKKYQEMALF